MSVSFVRSSCPRALSAALLYGVFAVGCSSSSSGPGPDGGESGSGGSGATGGTHTGGTSSGGAHSGGSPGTGGAHSGGSPGTGGMTTGGTGGSPGTGGDGGPDGSTEAGTGGDSGEEKCASLGALTPPTTSDTIEPPSGVTLVERFRGVGDQVYTCTGTQRPDKSDGGDAGVTFAWSAAVPDASLLDDSCKAVGKHSKGPTWTSNVDHSAVVGSKQAAVTPDATAVPWLLLKAVSHTGSGIFSSVTWVQRVDTVGGLAPTKACSEANANEIVRSPYTATYYFYDGPPPDAGDAGH